jgi:hypothetical protein
MRWLGKMNRSIPIGLSRKCPNRPTTHSNRFTSHKSITIIILTGEMASTRGFEVFCANKHALHTFPQIATCVPEYPEQCYITGVKNGWCPGCTICLVDIHRCVHRSTHCDPQQYLHFPTLAVKHISNMWNCFRKMDPIHQWFSTFSRNTLSYLFAIMHHASKH